MFHTYEQVLHLFGKHAAPDDRVGKIRCRLCSEWIPDYKVDRVIHARQERVGPRRLMPVSEHNVVPYTHEPWRAE